jgi:hypothetical protein
MSVNRYKILQKVNNQNFINIPINIDFDVMGRDDDIDRFELDSIKKIVGQPEDFEVDRFSHNINVVKNNETKLLQKYWFWNQDQNEYQNTYRADFTDLEIYYYANNFTNSFFKLEFYNSMEQSSQINYLTQIIPVQQGSTEKITLNNLNPPIDVNIKIPNFSLDFIGDKEGFFIYWLKSKTFVNIDKFYVSVKFFDAKNGIFKRFLNHEPPTSSTFDASKYFYYEYRLNYETKTYEVYGCGINSPIRYGIDGRPMVWYEYLNP